MKQLSLLKQCKERESGGTRCEAFLSEPDEIHNHFVSQQTIDAYFARKNAFYVSIRPDGVRYYP